MRFKPFLTFLLAMAIAVSGMGQGDGTPPWGVGQAQAGWKTKVAVVGGGVAAFEFQSIVVATVTAIMVANTPQYKQAVAALADKISRHPFVGPPAFLHGMNKAVAAGGALASTTQQLQKDVYEAQRHGEGSGDARAPPTADAGNPDPDDPDDQCAVRYIDPRQVLFSQDTVNVRFSTGGSVEDLITNLRNGSVTAENIPPIRLFEREGSLFTLDNRRLKAFQEAGQRIRYRMASEEEIVREAGKKLTTQNNGQSVEFVERGQKRRRPRKC